mgnify:CR=1 FL=1
MKIKHILACVAILVLAGLTVWYQTGSNTPVVTTSTPPSKTTPENRKVTSEDGSMMVTGGISGVDFDPGETTPKAPVDNPLWQAAYKDAQNQKLREELAKK